MNRSISWKLPLLLYLATWLTTTGLRTEGLLFNHLLAATFGLPKTASLWTVFEYGLYYSVPLMFILTCHELGHYIQTRRYGVPSSLPYFIPMPVGPFGTLGAVIAMDGRIPNRKALFDIGISGPIAGLIPTFVFLYFGIKWSHLVSASISQGEMIFGEPLLLQWMITWFYGHLPPDIDIALHPVAMAGWVGLFLTSLNLMPVGQLDGGHVFYALLGRRAGTCAWMFFYAAIFLVVFFRLWHWTLVLVLLSLIGIVHPPTANDSTGLTPFRKVLGWGTLAFILIGFTPTPLRIDDTPPQQQRNQWFAADFPTSGDLAAGNAAQRSDRISWQPETQRSAVTRFTEDCGR